MSRYRYVHDHQTQKTMPTKVLKLMNQKCTIVDGHADFATTVTLHLNLKSSCQIKFS